MPHHQWEEDKCQLGVAGAAGPVSIGCRASKLAEPVSRRHNDSRVIETQSSKSGRASRVQGGKPAERIAATPAERKVTRLA